MRIIGFGINEDRIRANVARRKAVEDKRDEAQDFLAKLAKKNSSRFVRYSSQPQPQVNRMAAFEDLASIGRKARQVISPDEMKIYKKHLLTLQALDRVKSTIKKSRGFKKAYDIFRSSVEALGSKIPEDIRDRTANKMKEYTGVSELRDIDIIHPKENETFNDAEDWASYKMSAKTPKLLIGLITKIYSPEDLRKIYFP